MRRGAAFSVAMVLVAALFGGTAAQARGPLPVTFVGDSVAASISYIPAAQRQLESGLRVQFDLRVCRRLVQPSCSYQGTAPSTALQAVHGYGRALGRVLIVNVGYNESAQGTGRGSTA